MTIWISKTKKKREVCETCKHFYQHYILPEESWMYKHAIRGFIPVEAGHCDHPRSKEREPQDSCKHYERRGKR